MKSTIGRSADFFLNLLCLTVAVLSWYYFVLPLQVWLQSITILILRPYLMWERYHWELITWLRNFRILLTFPLLYLTLSVIIYFKNRLISLTVSFGIKGRKFHKRPTGKRLLRRFRPLRMFALCGRWINRLFLFSIFLVIVAQGFFAGIYLKRLWNGKHYGLFREKCSQCHSYERPQHYLRTPGQWEFTIQRMRARAPDKIGQEEAVRIAFLLKHTNSLFGENLLHAKCLACHGKEKIFSRNRSRDAWERIIERVRKRNYYFIQGEEVGEILHTISRSGASLQEEEVDDRDRLAVKKRNLFEIKCGRCHALEVCLDPVIPKDLWSEILVRMGEKSPHVLSREESLSLEEFILGEIKVSEEFLERYPHSSTYLWTHGSLSLWDYVMLRVTFFFGV